ncbi:hypothetical protein [Chitinimonas sp. JJ19]|uniref:hypothetical protein n=1 Tax=Chitinimonas sp. JJ19 TaxID=3109352 RepID=UPI00300136DF
MNRLSLAATLIPALLCGSLLLGGCANLAAVNSYAGDTQRLTAAFEPMLAGSSHSCAAKYLRKKAITARDFDAAAAEKAAATLCGPIATDNKVMTELNGLLGQYADTLTALADEQLPSYKDEFGGLKDSLATVKRKGSADPLFDEGKLSAISGLATHLSRIATQRAQKAAIRDLLDHEVAVLAITNALNDYAQHNYRGWLKDEQRELALLREALDNAGKTEPLAANYLKTQLLAEEKQIAAREQAVEAFSTSIRELQQAHALIKQKYDQPDDKALAAQLKQFALAIAKLDQQAKAAF